MKKVDLSNDYDKYLAYLESRTWSEKRNMALERDEYHCSLCGNPNNLEVHHLRYPDVLGTESIADLMTLCCECHKKLEDYKKNHHVQRWKVEWYPPKKVEDHWVRFETFKEASDFAEQNNSQDDDDHCYKLTLYASDLNRIRKIWVTKEIFEYCKNNLDYMLTEKWI